MNHLNIQKVLIAQLRERVASYFLDSDGCEIPEHLHSNYENEQYAALATLLQRMEAARCTPDLDAVCRDLLAFDDQ